MASMQANNDTSISHHQRSFRRSLHGIISQPTNDTSISRHQRSLRQSLHGFNASQQQYGNLPPPAEPPTKSPWYQCKPQTIRQSPVSSGASDKVSTASSANQQMIRQSPATSGASDEVSWHQCKPTTIRPSPVTSGASDEVIICKPTNFCQSPVTSRASDEVSSASLASQQRYVNLPPPAELPTKSPWHHRPANNNTSVSRLQRSLRQSLHGIIGQPTTICQSPITSGASDEVSTASSASQQRYVNLPSPAEPPTKSPRHHRSPRRSLHGIIGQSISRYQRSPQLSLTKMASTTAPAPHHQRSCRYD